MPTQNLTLSCCKHATKDTAPFQVGSCSGASNHSIANVTASATLIFSPFDIPYILSRTCVSIVCVSGGLAARVTVGCLPMHIFAGTLTIEFDIIIEGNIPSHRVVNFTSGTDCPTGTCPEICT